MGSRPSHSTEFKIEAVELASQPGQTVTQVAQDLGIIANMLSHRNREAAADGDKAFGGQGITRIEELMRLHRDVLPVAMRVPAFWK